MILETQRLILRELKETDFENLCKILQDEVTMTAYEHAFSHEEVQAWLSKQLLRYQEDGFGLWAVILKQTGEFIGQCGITIQEIEGDKVPEIGYLFNRDFWHMGYASEAARGCKNYAFHTLGLKEIYSIIRDSNKASIKVAERNGMVLAGSFTKHYYGMDMPHYIYKAIRE